MPKRRYFQEIGRASSSHAEDRGADDPPDRVWASSGTRCRSLLARTPCVCRVTVSMLRVMTFRRRVCSLCSRIVHSWCDERMEVALRSVWNWTTGRSVCGRRRMWSRSNASCEHMTLISRSIRNLIPVGIWYCSLTTRSDFRVSHILQLANAVMQHPGRTVFLGQPVSVVAARSVQ